MHVGEWLSRFNRNKFTSSIIGSNPIVQSVQDPPKDWSGSIFNCLIYFDLQKLESLARGSDHAQGTGRHRLNFFIPIDLFR